MSEPSRAAFLSYASQDALAARRICDALRAEGYFRLEWKMAVERTNDMSDRAAFLVPVVIW